jgi:serine/threonine protein kinase
MQWSPGRVIASRYRLERLIGSGGMGFVWLARDEREGRPVAMKFLTADPGDDPQRRRRFLREAWAVSQLSHPCIVRVFESGEEPDGAAWMAMEFIDGTSFAAVLDRGPLPLRDVATVLVPVARALGAAHRAGFVHRDVKPDNVLVRGDGRPVLVDFGITRTIQHHAVNRGTLDQLTRTGMLVGTPEYMSPEQVRGLELDGRSDQFSLALVCFEALTGVRPFSGDNPMAVIAAVLTDDVPPVSDLAPSVPREVSDGIARALSKRPGDRFPDVDAFADLLEDFMPTAIGGIDVRALDGGAGWSGGTLPGSRTVTDVEGAVPRNDPTTEPRAAAEVPAPTTFEEFARTVIEMGPDLDAAQRPASDELDVGARTLVKPPRSEPEAPRVESPFPVRRASYPPLQQALAARASPRLARVFIALALAALVIGLVRLALR